MKKRLVLVTTLVAVLVLGIVGGTALAQEDGTGADSPVKSFAARVATILGLDEAKVEDAMKQATKEMQDEGLKRKLDMMVQNGRLTQEEADQIYDWYQSRPEVLSPGLPFGGMRGHGFHHGRMWGGPMWGGFGQHMQPAPTPTPDSSTTTSF